MATRSDPIRSLPILRSLSPCFRARFHSAAPWLTFEPPNKIGLSIADYFLVQQAYRGWNRLAIILLVQFAALCASAVMSRRPPIVFWCCVTAIGWLVAAQLLFWSFTYPANVATANWTQMPANAGHLRIQWEYSHAAGAACQLLAMSFLAVAVLARVRRRS